MSSLLFEQLPSCFFVRLCSPLVHLLLLVDAELAGAAVDEQEESADNREDLEEIVLGEVLVGVAFVKLRTFDISKLCLVLTRKYLQSRSC